MSITTLNAYQQGGPILDKLKQLWGGIRSKADDPSLGYIGASMLPGVGEATDLVEIGAGLQDRSLGRVGLGLAGLMLPFVGAAGLKKIGKKAGDKYFSPEALSQARGRSDSKGHYVDMDPRTFLELTDTGGEGFGRSIDPEKLERVKNLIKEGTLFESSPHLAYRKGPESDIAEVFGEEGRHRAKALADLGVESMPVRVRHVGSYEILQGNPDDYGGLWPRVLRGRSGDVEIAYPVSDPRAARKLPMDDASVLRRIKDQEYDELLHGTKGKEDLYRLGLKTDSPFYQSDNLALTESYTPQFTKELSSVIDADKPSLETVRAIREAINPQVVKVYSRAPNQLVFDAGGSFWRDIPVANVRRGIDPSRHKEFDAIAERLRQYGPEGPVIATNDLDKVAKEMGYSGWDAHNLRDASYSSADRVGKAAHLQDHPLLDYYTAGDAPSFVRSSLDPGNIRYEGARFDPSKIGIPDPLAGIAGLAGARYMSNALREDQS